MYQFLTKMSKFMYKKREKLTSKTQNVLLNAYNATPKGECNNKLNEIAEKCEVDARTVRRWIKEGKTPKKWMFLAMADIFNNIAPSELDATLTRFYSK